MALSTEYYCFEKKKFTPEVLNSLFLSQISRLIDNIKYRLGRLKCQKKLRGHIEEYMDILKVTTK